VRHGAVLASRQVGVVDPEELEVLRGGCGVLPREAKGDNALARYGDCEVDDRRQHSCIAPLACVPRRTLIVQGDGHALDARHDLGLHGEFFPTIEQAATRIPKIQLGTRSQVRIEFLLAASSPATEKTTHGRSARGEEHLERGEMPKPTLSLHWPQKVCGRIGRGVDGVEGWSVSL
jgi:hypothetical protein